MSLSKPHIFLLLMIGNLLTVNQENFATILWVPDNYSTIQNAINAASSGDSVLIRAGVYTENIVIPDHNITLAGEYLFSNDSTDRDECILRPLSGGRSIYAPPVNSTRLLRIIGLTARGGVSSNISRGGIDVRNRNLELRWCRIDSSYSHEGGAIYAYLGSVLIQDCRIHAVGSNLHGHAILMDNLTAHINATEIENTFSMTGNDDQVTIKRGAVELRNCSLHDYGMNSSIGTSFVNPDGRFTSVNMVGCDIYQSRYQHFFAAPFESDPGKPVIIRFDSNFVHNNQIQDYLFSTNLVDSGTRAKFIGNIFQNNFDVPNTISYSFFGISDIIAGEIEITRNLFLNNHSRENSCANISTTNNLDFAFKNNYLIGNSNNAFAYPPGGAIIMITSGDSQVVNNVIYGNRGFAVFRGLIDEGPAHSENNYWGAVSGPYDSVNNPQGQGDTVEYRVLYTPWQTDTSFLQSVEEPSVSPTIPTDFLIGFAYPNPFNSEVTIEYVVTGTHFIKLEVFDLLGRKIETLVNELQSVGIHQAHWQGINFSSGIYFARLSAEGSPQPPWLQKLILLK